jgi:sterol desaturase/sphingolipid hydroxylase (fatty acid hydroxylase superfamily)
MGHTLSLLHIEGVPQASFLAILVVAAWLVNRWGANFRWTAVATVVCMTTFLVWNGPWGMLALFGCAALFELSGAFPRRKNHGWASNETILGAGVRSAEVAISALLLSILFHGTTGPRGISAIMKGLSPTWGMTGVGTPLVLQIVAFMLINDLKFYWLHRRDHAFRFFWRFHKIHHSQSEIYWLSVRDHPSYALERDFSVIAIAFLLGISFEAVLIEMGTRIAIASVVAHLNVDFPNLEDKFPWWAYLIVTPNYHAWHHTLHSRYNANLAEMFPIWDVIFGTFEHPRGSAKEWEFGLDEKEQIPNTIAGQLLSPISSRTFSPQLRKAA